MIDANHSRKLYPVIVLLLLILLAAGGYIVLLNVKQSTSSKPSPAAEDGTLVTPAPGGHDNSLADLGARPDWSTLDLWQETITRDDFHRLLTEVYTIGNTWKRLHHHQP